MLSSPAYPPRSAKRTLALKRTMIQLPSSLTCRSAPWCPSGHASSMLSASWRAERTSKIAILSVGVGHWPYGTSACRSSLGLGLSAQLLNSTTTLPHTLFVTTSAMILPRCTDRDPPVYGCNCSSSANSLNYSIHYLSSFTRNLSFSYIGTITSRSSSTAGIPTSPPAPVDFSSLL